MLLTIGMIVKNEEKVLRKCLESLRPILDNVDSELIIADTGSEDSTMDIAREFTDNVYAIKWRDDFAWARNTTLSRAKGKWYMFIDADEAFQDCKDLIEFFNSGEYKKYGSAFYHMYDIDKDGQAGPMGTLIRLFRIDKNTRFIGKIHEYIPAMKPAKLLTSYIHHSGYTFDGEEGELTRKIKHERNLKPLLEEYEKSPKDRRIIVLLINQFAFGKDYDKQKEFIDLGLEICDKTTSEYQFMIKALVGYYMTLKQYEKVIEVIHEYFQEGGKLHAVAVDMRVIESVAYGNMGLIEKQLAASLEALELLKKYDKGELDTSALIYVTVMGVHVDQRSMIVSNTVECYFKLSDFDNLFRFASEYIVFKTIMIVCLRCTIKKDLYEKASLLYEYVKQRYGMDSDEYTECLTQFEANGSDPQFKTSLAKALSELNSDGDDYIELNKLRAFHAEKRPETGDLLAYFINSDVIYDLTYSDVIPIAIQTGVDFSKFVDKMHFEWLPSFINKTIKQANDLDHILPNLIEKNAWLNDCESVKTKQFFYALEGELLQDTEKLKDDTKIMLFEHYISMYYQFLRQVYKDEVFNSAAIDVLPRSARFAYYAGEAYALKQNEDYEGFIAGIKSALKHDSDMKDLILLVLDRLKQLVGGGASKQAQLEKETAALKKIIINLIQIGDFGKARSILANYEQINPSDPDIPKIYALL